MSEGGPLERRSAEAPAAASAAAQPEEAAMSEFVYLFRSSESEQREFMGPERAQQSMQVWVAWMRGLEEKGHLKNPGQPLGLVGKVVRGKQKTVTDGPYLEAKDLVAGFILIEARDLAQAAELAKGCPMLEGGGSVEVRPVNEMVLSLNRKIDPERAARWRGSPQ